jgi:protoporphyrinogen oxidase
MSDSYDLIVIGAGIMGLAAAYEATLKGKRVLVLEAGEIPGGMAAHTDLGGLSIERYYHFICKTDFDTFDLLKDLGIEDSLKWRTTKMGYYIDGTLYKWGNPFALLKFPKLNLIDKFRYALLAFSSTKRKDWSRVEPLTAPEWIENWVGKKTYKMLWHRLLYLKFYQYTDEISASWIGTRIKRIGLSRKSILEEKLGYLKGGTQTLVAELVNAIEKAGSEIICNSRVEHVSETDGSVTSVKTKEKAYKSSRVISTMPTPFVSDVIPSLPEKAKAKYDAIPNIGVCCLLFKLKKPVTQNFWLNVIDDEHNIPGIIEFSNLRPTGEDHVVYVPYYMPHGQERWGWKDKELIDEAFNLIRSVNPDISDGDVLSTQVNRLRYAQPICRPGFLDTLPDIQTDISGLQVADTCFYYPEDRGISESIKLGRSMARSAFL